MNPQWGGGFDCRRTSNSPGAVIGIPDSIAAVGETEFSIPVVRSEKMEYDFLRLQWGVTSHRFF